MQNLSRICYLTFHRKRPLSYLSSISQYFPKTDKSKMALRKALLLSSSNCYGYNTLEFAKEEITRFLKQHKISDIMFVPYAKNDFNNYTAHIRDTLAPWGFRVTGIHTFDHPTKAIINAKAIFIGGGNTFLLLKRLYEYNLVDLIRKQVYDGNLVYIGSSAGTNVATASIHTTNDMPITFPPTFHAIGIVPFNINPHYIDTVESEKHKGETRDQRIAEFLQMPYASSVLGLREGSILIINGLFLTVKGVAGAVLFQKGQDKIDIAVGSDVSYLNKVVATKEWE